MRKTKQKRDQKYDHNRILWFTQWNSFSWASKGVDGISSKIS